MANNIFQGNKYIGKSMDQGRKWKSKSIEKVGS
jgi:hypothetical protein